MNGRRGRQIDSTNDRATCTVCDTPIRGVVTRGPSDHFLDPCGCRITTATVRDLSGGADRGRGVVADGGVDSDRVYRDPDGRLLSVVIDGERLRFNEERSSTGHTVFERDHGDFADLAPKDRPSVVLSTTTTSLGWTVHYYPENTTKVGDAIGLSKDETQTTEDELHLYADGSPDVTIEYLEHAECEEVDA